MASEQEIIQAIRTASNAEIRVRIIDQLGHRIRPHHRKLIRFLVDMSQSEREEQVSYSVRRALFQIRSRYNITNFALFLMDPLTLLQSSDPAYRLKALETFESDSVTLEQCYYFLGSLYFESDAFVLVKMLKILPRLGYLLSSERIGPILMSYLNHPDKRVREAATQARQALGKTTEDESLDALWQALSDQDQRVREQAVYRLLEMPRTSVLPRLTQTLSFSQDFYVLSSCLKLCEKGTFAIEPALIQQVAQTVEGLRQQMDTKVVEVQSRPALELESLTEYEPERDRSAQLFPILLALVCLQSLLLFVSPVDRTPAPLPAVKEATQKVEIQEETKIKPVEEPVLDLAAKIRLFENQGKMLRENADRFLGQANLAYEEERYAEANQLYMSLYEVYKDNRMAVDAVRLLSRTQKVQNVLESVKEYVSKFQFVSAVKKLEEIKHLVTAEVFRKHFETIEASRIKHQEGSQNQ